MYVLLVGNFYMWIEYFLKPPMKDSVSQKHPPLRFSDIFPKRLGIYNQFLHKHYTILSTLDYKFLVNYFQL